MSDLTQFRNWCRKQAETCVDVVTATGYHDRALWTLLADEVDAYLGAEMDHDPTPEDAPLEGM